LGGFAKLKMNIINALNNREIATAIWLTIILLWALSNSSVRRAILEVLKAFFNQENHYSIDSHVTST